jgi:hypothetical protein
MTQLLTSFPVPVVFILGKHLLLTHAPISIPTIISNLIAIFTISINPVFQLTYDFLKQPDTPEFLSSVSAEEAWETFSRNLQVYLKSYVAAFFREEPS